MPQLSVLFDAWPHPERASMLDALRAMEPGREACDAEEVIARARPDGRRLAATAIRIGAQRVAAVVSESPLPPAASKVTLESSPWKPEVRGRLLAHRAFAALRCIGGGTPIEQWVALYKVAAALDGIGVANEETWSSFPAEVLDALSWERLRTEAMPVELVTGFVTTERWHLSRGHGLFGFPDFASPAGGRTEEIYALFKNLFLYMFARGEPVRAEDTAEVKGGVRCSIEAATEEERKFLGGERLIVRPAPPA